MDKLNMKLAGSLSDRFVMGAEAVRCFNLKCVLTTCKELTVIVFQSHEIKMMAESTPAYKGPRLPSLLGWRAWKCDMRNCLEIRRPP